MITVNNMPKMRNPESASDIMKQSHHISCIRIDLRIFGCDFPGACGGYSRMIRPFSGVQFFRGVQYFFRRFSGRQHIPILLFYKNEYSRYDHDAIKVLPSPESDDILFHARWAGFQASISARILPGYQSCTIEDVLKLSVHLTAIIPSATGPYNVRRGGTTDAAGAGIESGAFLVL
jgi:hypothetical protein